MRKTIRIPLSELAADWAYDLRLTEAEARRFSEAIAYRTSDNGGLLDAAFESLIDAGYTKEEANALADELALLVCEYSEAR